MNAHDLLQRACSRHPLPVDCHLTVVAAGKAAQPMADAFARRYGNRVRDLFVARGGHPIPDAASVESGRRALRMAGDAADRGELFVLLLSGGASAMLCAPAEGISLKDKAAVTRLLLSSGLAIGDINAVRKHLSAIKGGQLGVRARQSVTFALSDVCAPIEDDPAVIGSGPAVADPTTFGDAERALRRGGLWDAVPAAVRDRLGRGARGELPETSKPGDQGLASAEFVLAGSRRDAMAGAREAAASLGYEVECIGPPTTGDAVAAASAFAGRARRSARPLCIVASGETTVALPSSGASGVGGRNQEFALAAAAELAGVGPCALASVGTDGIDGPTPAAGAITDSTTMARAMATGLDPAAFLAAHDSHRFFHALDDLIVTGPTGTNVGDLQLLLLGGQV